MVLINLDSESLKLDHNPLPILVDNFISSILFLNIIFIHIIINLNYHHIIIYKALNHIINNLFRFIPWLYNGFEYFALWLNSLQTIISLSHIFNIGKEMLFK